LPFFGPAGLMPETVYTLERLNWRPNRTGLLALPGADPLRTFTERSTAEAVAREREWEVRQRVNPFTCGGPCLAYQTSFDAARLYDWFLDHGLDPPGPTADSSAWAAAWNRDRPHLTDARRAAAWEALDRVRFFRVRPGLPRRPMHLVAVPHYERDPVEFEGYGIDRYVGCTPYMLVRRTDTANGLCHDLYMEQVLRREELMTFDGDLGSSWVLPDSDPLAGEEAPADESYGYGPQSFAEHRPLDLVADRDPTPGHTVYIVLRRHWRQEIWADGSWRFSLTDARTCGRPVAAFPTLSAADALVAELEAEARTYPSPFRFGPALEWGTLHASGVYGFLSQFAPIDFASLWTDYLASDHAWIRWWDNALPSLSAEQIAEVWALFENLRFYEVVAVEYRE
jgi:hypothetical protein